MFSYALSTGNVYLDNQSIILTLSTASTYFYLPIDEEEDADIENYQRKYLTWIAEPSGLSNLTQEPNTFSSTSSTFSKDRADILNTVLSSPDLYAILGVPKSASLDKMSLRRAYLARSKDCHPEYV